MQKAIQYYRVAGTDADMAKRIIAKSVSITTRCHLPPLFLSSFFCGGFALLCGCCLGAPSWCLCVNAVVTVFSSALHYGQNYRGIIATIDGITVKVAGVVFTFLELIDPNSSSCSRMLAAGLLFYSATVFYVCLRGAWFDARTGAFRPYTVPQVALHVSVHCSGAGLAILGYATKRRLYERTNACGMRL